MQPSKLKHPPEEIKAFLGKENVVEGKITFEGIFHLDGTFKGEIRGGGTLILGETAAVKGKLGIDTLVVKGKLEGEVEARARVEIHSSGEVHGIVFTPALTISDGGFFDGHCKMDGKLDDSKEGGKENG